MNTLFALLIMALPANDMELAKQHSTKGAYEESLAVLQKVKKDDDYYTYCYLMAVNHCALNHREEAISWAEKVAHNPYFTDDRKIPERYKVVAFMILEEAKTWKKDANDLGDISREMEISKNRLRLGKGGKETQEIQNKILSRLDKMIKDIEDKKKAEEDAKNAKEAKEAQDADAEQRAGNQQNSDNKSNSPQTETQGGHANGTGQVNKKKVRELAEVWGKLPDKERAQAMRDLLRTVPAKDKAVIEAYLREMQKRSRK